ncbi:MAG: hypothetical protein Q8O30_03305 [Candidatus Omnitrophota bacterium]|nr:hypothetical protein [Candidatus Omnitrophota bacterium]
MITISRQDLLTSFEEFERQHNITTTRNDVPRKFLGVCPTKYYKVIDMNVDKITKAVSKLFKKIYRKDF